MKKTLNKKIEAAKSKPEAARKFPARFTPALYGAIETEAARQGISMNSFVSIACQEAVDTLKKRTG